MKSLMILLLAWPAGAAAPGAKMLTDGWPEPARAVAARAVDKYGAPDDIEADYLRWTTRGPWAAVTVYRDQDYTRRSGLLEQAVSFDVPPARWRDLTALEVGVAYDSVLKQLVASSESEDINILALNVAVDVIKGRRDVLSARDFYRRTFDLALSGKSSRYMRRLLFSPAGKPAPHRPARLKPLMP